MAHIMEHVWLPWTCYCGKRNNKAAGFCQGCGQPWDPVYLNQIDPNNPPWPEEGTWPQHGGDQSPRRRRPSRKRNGKGGKQGQPSGKGQGHGRGQGQGKGGKQGQAPGQGVQPGKGQGQGKGKTKSEPTWTPPVTAPVTPPQPPGPPAAKDPTPAEAALKSLVAALKQTGEPLPSDVQDALQAAANLEQKNSGKNLHSAVSRWTRAQGQHAAAVQARTTLHSAWRSFVEEATSRWEAYAAEFTQQDQELQAGIVTAKENLVAAKTELDQLNMQVSGGGASASDASSTPAASAEAMTIDQEAQRLEANSQRINASLTTLVTGLHGVRKRAEEVINVEEDERPTARPRHGDDNGAPFTSPGA